MSNYNYHFIIEELIKIFEGRFNCLGENTEKYRIFLVQIRKVKIIGTIKEYTTKTIYYKLEFTDRATLMANSLSNFVDNLAKGIHKSNANLDKLIKNTKNVEIHSKILSLDFNTQILKMS